MNSNNEDWSVECSDDEKYGYSPKTGWKHKPEDILSLIEKLESQNQVIELEWKCPGRRERSPLPVNNHEQDAFSEDKPIEKSDFDFMDEMASPRLPVRKSGETTPRGSAKKKTASFNGVISTMLRHRRLEQQEISSPKIKEPSSPATKS